MTHVAPRVFDDEAMHARFVGAAKTFFFSSPSLPWSGEDIVRVSGGGLLVDGFIVVSRNGADRPWIAWFTSVADAEAFLRGDGAGENWSALSVFLLEEGELGFRTRHDVGDTELPYCPVAFCWRRGRRSPRRATMPELRQLALLLEALASVAEEAPPKAGAGVWSARTFGAVEPPMRFALASADPDGPVPPGRRDVGLSEGDQRLLQRLERRACDDREVTTPSELTERWRSRRIRSQPKSGYALAGLVRLREAPGVRRVKLAQGLLSIDPHLIEALVACAENHPDESVARSSADRVVLDGDELPETSLLAWRGGWFLARGDLVAAARDLAALVLRDPDDDEGTRYDLLRILFARKRNRDILRLVVERKKCASALWAYAEALVRFQAGAPFDGAEHALARALVRNLHYVEELTGLGARDSAKRPGDRDFSAGGPVEARVLAPIITEFWRATPGACAWLEAHAAVALERDTTGFRSRRDLSRIGGLRAKARGR